MCALYEKESEWRTVEMKKSSHRIIYPSNSDRWENIRNEETHSSSWQPHSQYSCSVRGRPPCAPVEIRYEWRWRCTWPLGRLWKSNASDICCSFSYRQLENEFKKAHQDSISWTSPWFKHSRARDSVPHEVVLLAGRADRLGERALLQDFASLFVSRGMLSIGKLQTCCVSDISH